MLAKTYQGIFAVLGCALACSAYAEPATTLAAEAKAMATKPAAATPAPAATTTPAASTATSAPTAKPTATAAKKAPAKTAPVTALTAQLKLQQRDERLYADVVIRQPQDVSGTVQVVWMPPAPNTVCSKSNYDLSYHGKHFHTYAYRTLSYGAQGKSRTCAGTWQVKVVDGKGNNLASDSIKIAAK